MYVRQELPGVKQTLLLHPLKLGPLLLKGTRVFVKSNAAAHHFRKHVDVVRRLYIDGQAKAIEELRPQFPLFGIHGAHQNKGRRMTDRHAFALDVIDSHGGSIKQNVDNVIAEQIHFIDIQHAAMGRRQQARLKVLFATFEGTFNIQRARHPVLSHPEGQLDQTRRSDGR